MNNYVIRLAKTEDIKTIQQLSQELIEYEKSNVVCLRSSEKVNSI